MKHLISTLLALVLGIVVVQAQFARLQVIHNAVAPASVDVYVNGALTIDNFAFRAATPFINIPAGIPLTVAVAPASSTSAAQAFFNTTLTLENGKTYAVTALGIQGNAATPFTLVADDAARESAASPGKVAVNVLHGSPDAPAVDVAGRIEGKLVSNLAYGAGTPYLELAPNAYYLDVKPAGQNAIVATYKADLSALTGGGARVFASGLLNGTPAFGLFAALPDGTVLELPLSPVARVQVIHNSPDQSVDVYANGDLLIDDLAFRNATAFAYVPTGNIDLGVALDNSLEVSDTIANFKATLVNGGTYVVMATGIVGDPNAPLTLVINADGRELAGDTARTDVIFFHGSPDAPAVDADVIFEQNNAAQDLAYGEFSSAYLSILPGKTDVTLRVAGTSNKIGTFRANLTALKGQGVTVFASGFVSSAPDFGLFAAFPDGTVQPLVSTPFARWQIIHNSPDPVVDVYAGRQRVIDNFAFRTATPFLDVPADRNINVSVAPGNSVSVANAIATFPVSLQSGQAYAVFASGIVGDPATPFTLLADAAREAAQNPAKVEFATLHGSPGAPAVDVAVSGGPTLISDLAYGEFAPYLAVDPATYLLNVKVAGTGNIVGTFSADLSALAGGAARVFASGLVGGTPAFGLFAALPNGTVVEFPKVNTPATARLQVIHNSPSATVDVYANGTLLLNDFAFRTATPFLDVPADVPVDIQVATANSTSSASAFATFTVTFEAGKTYVATAAGFVGDPNTPFTLFVNGNGRETAQSPAGVDVAVLHGAPGAPAVDVDAVFVANNVVQNLAYGNYSPYLSLDAAKYDFAVRASGAPDVLVSYRADLSGLAGGAATVFASGLIGGLPAFGLFAATAGGAVVELPLTPLARVQVIHNSPDPTVDVYAGTRLIIDDFAFRTATPFIDFPADRSITVGVAGAGSISSSDALASFPVSFEAGKTYAVFANGIVGNASTPFTLLADAARELASNPAKVEFATLHGSPGAPAVDVAAIGFGDLITDLAYGAFTPYLSVDPGIYTLQVKVAGTNTTVGYFQADLSPLVGGAARVFASGLVGGAPGFGLFAALPDGTVVEFLPVSAPATARVQIIHNSPSPTVDIYANGDLLLNDFAFRTATPFIDVLANVPYSIAVAPGTSTSVADAIATFPVQFEQGKSYIVTASGLVGNPATPFTLIVNANAREAAVDPGLVDVAVLHGAPDAPAVDVDAVFTANNVVQNLAYGNFTPYLNLPATRYDLAVRGSGSPDVVASYRADLSGLAGGAAWVFASGLLGGSPAFGLFAALPDGTVLELPLTPTARVQIVHNSPDPTVDVYAGNTLLIDNFEFRSATPFVDVPADRSFPVGIAPAGSTTVADAIATFPVSFETGKRYTVMAAGVVGSPVQPFTLYVDGNARETNAPGFSTVSAFHGLFTAAPLSIEVEERLIGPLTGSLAFGAYSPYVELANGDYYLDVVSAGSGNLLGTHYLDPALFANRPARLFTSGILGNNTVGYGLYAVFPDGTVAELPFSPVARVQIIHNAPSPTVDIYAGTVKVLDDFAFRSATPFFYATAGVQFDLGVAPANSQSAADVIATFPATFENQKTYIVVADGIVGGTPAFNLVVNDQGRERAVESDKLELAVHHGSPGAPAVDVTSALTGQSLITGLAYGDFTDYLSLVPDAYLLDLSATGAPNPRIGTWGGDFGFAAGVAGVVFASGLPGGDPALGLWLALPDGTTLPLPAFARAQVIHNAPSPTVDVYLDDEQVIDDFVFHQATGIGFLPAGTPFTLSVAPATSTSVSDAIYNLPVELETGKTYVIMAAGVVGGNPGFGLFVNANGRDRAYSLDNVEVSLFHGSPDAPEVDVQVPGGPVLFDNVEFGEFTDYLSVPPANYTLQITPADNNAAVVKSYKADLSTSAGEAITVFASGFLAGGQPGFQAWVAETDGDTYPLEELVRTNELDDKLGDLQLSPNPAVTDLLVRFNLNESEQLRYGIRELTGRLLQEGDFGTVNAGNFAQKLDVGALPPGLYLLEIVSDAGVKAVKFAVGR